MTLSRRNILSGLGGTAVFAAFAPSVALSATPLKVVATTGMIADAARVVGGEMADVRALMGPGVDPHAYRQTRTDILAMTRADLVLWNGLYLEAQMEDFFYDLSRRVTVVPVGESVAGDKLISHDTYDSRHDPHVWMDPTLWRDVVSAVRDAMSLASPENANWYQKNAARYLEELTNLGEYAQNVLSSVPRENRVLVTAHDAFNYFGRAHDFDVIGIQGISTESEAGLNRIGALVDLLVDRKIGAVFVESSVSDRSIRALIEGAKSRGHDVRVGGELYSDAMGPTGSYEGTYIGMIDHNATVIARALGADVPARGMSGKLGLGS